LTKLVLQTLIQIEPAAPLVPTGNGIARSGEISTPELDALAGLEETPLLGENTSCG